jgi:N-formylglutamate amidohydrolase
MQSCTPRPVLIDRPDRITTHVVFASPHSGRVYPPDMTSRARLDPLVLRSSEDAYVDLLLAGAPALGAPLVTTEVPRAYVDFNRAETELDPALIAGVPRGLANPRVAAGLGVIARVVAGGEPIYRGSLTLAEAEDRIARFWRPYHRALGELVEAQRARFGEVLLVDVHSMPRAALSGLPRTTAGGRPDVVLGDRHGAACRPGLLEAVEAVIRAEGLRVARNSPFAGAYVASRYGRPGQGMHVVQLEIDRSLYLDEARVALAPGFDAFCRVMHRIVAGIAALGRPAAMPLAAE